ncbi:hypothetical protein [Haloquadratum walsbyi]|nr:hypothetical protein [Haloquadratum walsbyi]
MSIRALNQQNPDNLRFRVDQVVSSEVSKANGMKILYCTDIERTQTRVAVTSPSPEDNSFEWQQGQWYEFNQITRSHEIQTAGTPAFAITSGNKNCERIEPPAIDSPSRSEESIASNMSIPKLSERSDRIGLAVTVIPASGEQAISPDNPAGYEITAVCIDSFDTPTDPPVYHRAAADSHDERILLEHVVEDLRQTDARTILTWSNTSDSIELLASRHQQLADGNILYRENDDVFDGFYYADLSRLGVRHNYTDSIKMAQSLDGDITAEYPRFDPDAIENDPNEWRAEWDLAETPLTDRTDTRLTKQDYRTLLESHFAGNSTTPDALATCLQSFVSAQLEPLHSISTHNVAAHLGCPRLITA